MNYQAISTETLKKLLKQKRLTIKWLKTNNFLDLEKSFEKDISNIEAELAKREKEKVWI